QSPWQARTLGSQKKRRALAGADVANVCRTPGRQRKTFEAVFRQHTGKSRAIVEDGVRNAKDRPGGNADRLAVERVAASPVEEDCVRPESRCVSEDRSDIVVVGDADKHQCQGTR